MVSTEVWMGSGQSVTLAPESELFLGYMPYGPTLGRTGTNKAHLIKYSLGYALDGSSVVIENAHGEGTNAVKHFTDYYHLVPDLYTGCIAKFFYTDASGTAATYRFSAVVAGNDSDAIYFAGNINDYPNLFADADAAVGAGRERGYIVLEANGSIIPAPISLENRGTVTSYSANEEKVECAADAGTTASLKAGDLLYEASGNLVGTIFSCNAAAAGNDRTDATTSTTRIHTISEDICRGAANTPSNSIGTLTCSSLQSGLTTLTGFFTAGDYISKYASDDPTSATIVGKVISIDSTGLIITFAQAGSGDIDASDFIYWGRDLAATASSETTLHTVSPRILSNNWIGLTNTVTTPTIDVEMKQVSLALAGTRNYSYQYRGIETAGQASIDVNLNHGSWLNYIFGTLDSVSCSKQAEKDHTNAFETADTAPSNHILYAGVNTGTDTDFASTGHSTLNGKFHRVLKGSQALCPPLLPNTSAFLVTQPSVTTGGALQDGITYTFGEKNDNLLPSFALELLVQKGSKIAGTGASFMVDRNTFNEDVYAEIYPGCVVNDMTLSANENEELKCAMNLNVKRVFDAPNGYVGKCYDSTNNDTSEFKNLLNFGQQTGSHTNIEQTFVNPFYFSDGSISMFGQEFMRVSSFNLTMNNTLTDKRYIGQYNKQIKSYVPGLRTYEIQMNAQVTDRRIFDELRRASPHRFDLNDTAGGNNTKIELVFTKDNGEKITLQFDDFLIGSTTWPIQTDDRGPIMVDFTVMPLRVKTLTALTHWVMQS
tara:strand:- start:2242 stop:4551 length:2310 start_codon:yes stop_codon:yes gene_type:complete